MSVRGGLLVCLPFFSPGVPCKNQSGYVSSPLASFSSLRSVLGPDDRDIFLCPVRALRSYLARTKSFRRAKRRLFVSFNPKYCSDVAKGTVSRWFLDLIKLAYARSLVRLPDNPIRAHELRAISSSLAVVKGVPLVKVMASAFW